MYIIFFIAFDSAFLEREDEFISKVAKTEKDICFLIEQGFEYVTKFQGAKIFRKRKL